MWQGSRKESGKEHNWEVRVTRLKQSLPVSCSYLVEVLMFVKQSEAA